MSRNKVDELTRHAVAELQKLAKDQGFKRLPDEKAFMDELSGEDDGPRIIVRRRFTTLSDAELAEARVWWEGLSEGEKMRDGVENHLGDIEITFTVRFPEGAEGDRARERLPKAIAQSRDRLCTVSRTVQRGADVHMRDG